MSSRRTPNKDIAKLWQLISPIVGLCVAATSSPTTAPLDLPQNPKQTSAKRLGRIKTRQNLFSH